MNLIYYLQSHIEIEGYRYSIAYSVFNRIAAFEALYHQTSVKGGLIALHRCIRYSFTFEVYISPALMKFSDTTL